MRILTDTGLTKAFQAVKSWAEGAFAALSHSHESATSKVSGFMSVEDKKKLDNISPNANAYVHPSYPPIEDSFTKVGRDKTGHVIIGDLVEKSDITALGIPGQDTTYQSKAAASGGTDLSLVTTGEKAVWNAKTSNAGTVTKVSAGVGLAGGDITGSGTVKAKLRSETALANASAAATETAGRVYPVAQDKDGYLAVNVPWVDTNTQTITGVKGNSESAYRTGQVNLTAANIGALPISGGTMTGDIDMGQASTSGFGNTHLLIWTMANGAKVKLRPYNNVWQVIFNPGAGNDVGLINIYQNGTVSLESRWRSTIVDLIGEATTSTAGLLSAADKTKLNNLSGGGVVVASTAPAGDSSKLWIDTASGGVAKYWNGTAWTACKSVWG